MMKNQDTLQEIADGATPGESKKTTEPITESVYGSDDVYNDGYDNYDSYDNYGY